MDANDELREALRAFGNRRAQAMQEARLGPEARELVARGRGAIPVTEMAQLLGVSRRTVYDVLRQEQS